MTHWRKPIFRAAIAISSVIMVLVLGTLCAPLVEVAIPRADVDPRVSEFFWRYGLVLDVDRCRNGFSCGSYVTFPILRQTPTLGDFISRVGPPDKYVAFNFQTEYDIIAIYGYYISRGFVIEADRWDGRRELAPDMHIRGIRLWNSTSEEALRAELITRDEAVAASILDAVVAWPGYGPLKVVPR